MIFDLKNEPPPDGRGQYDVCIAGGGIAGITVAVDLAARGRRVLLLEAGGFEQTEDSQAAYAGENIGRPYFDLELPRLRYLGGSSNHWTGLCLPLDTHDFKARPYIPESGWPFGRDAIAPYLSRAADILDVKPAFTRSPLKGAEQVLEQFAFQFSPPTNFRDKYEGLLRDSDLIDVFINAPLVDVVLDEAGQVAKFLCASFNDPESRIAFAADCYVLALGGIENARLLLNANKQMANGIGNAHDLVGRYFMEHYHVSAGFYIVNQGTWPFEAPEVYLAPSEHLMARLRIGNAGVRLLPHGVPTLARRVKNSIKRTVSRMGIVRDLVDRVGLFTLPMDVKPPGDAGRIVIVSEQAPNHTSRVTLSEKTDRFGLRRSVLDWQASPLDKHTIKATVREIGCYLEAQGYADVKIAAWLQQDDPYIPGVGEDDWVGAGQHHMGTTRMAGTPQNGVVDPDCRVFGVENLFIAGSSVFPTSGHANPTLTIVQLALRLCDTIDKQLSHRVQGQRSTV